METPDGAETLFRGRFKAIRRSGRPMLRLGGPEVASRVCLSEEQRRALKLLSAASDQSVSDLVRRAVDRLLSDELASDDWGAAGRPGGASAVSWPSAI